MRPSRWVGLGAALAMLTIGAPAVAGRHHNPNWIRIRATTPLTEPTVPGTFEAFAVEGGLCPSGTTTDDATVSQAADYLRFDVRKTFTCGDGSGSFVVAIDARFHFCDPFDYGTWKIVDGTGAYTKLRGGGNLVGLYPGGDGCDTTSVVDYFRGDIRVGGRN